MGLLSKAAEGSSGNAALSHGGLLKIITQKHRKQSEDGFSIRIVEDTPAMSSPLEKAVMEKLNICHSKFGIFQGMIIEALKYSAGEFNGRLSFMVSGFGIAQGLAPGRALVVFSSDLDGELIAIHLAKCVPGKKIFSFHADTPQDAFLSIKTYL